MDKSRGTAAPVDFGVVARTPGAKLKANRQGVLQVQLPRQTGTSRLNLKAALRHEEPGQTQARANQHSLSKMSARYDVRDVKAGNGADALSRLDLKAEQSAQTKAGNRKANAAETEAFVRYMRTVVPPDRLASEETRIRDRVAALPPKVFANQLAITALEYQSIPTEEAAHQRETLRAQVAMHVEAMGGRSHDAQLLDRAVDLYVADRSIAEQLGEPLDEKAGIARALSRAKPPRPVDAPERESRAARLIQLDRLVRESGQLDRTPALELARLRLEAGDMKGEFDAKARQLASGLRTVAPRIEDAPGLARLQAAWEDCSTFFASSLPAADASPAAVDASVEVFMRTVDPSVPKALLRQAVLTQSRGAGGPGVDMLRALAHLRQYMAHDLAQPGRTVTQANASDLMLAIMKAAAGLPVRPLDFNAVVDSPMATVQIKDGEYAIAAPRSSPFALAPKGIRGEDPRDGKRRELSAMLSAKDLSDGQKNANRRVNEPVAQAFTKWLEASPHVPADYRLISAPKNLAIAVTKNPAAFAAYLAKLMGRIDTSTRLQVRTLAKLQVGLVKALDAAERGAAPSDPKWRQQIIGLAMNIWTEADDARYADVSTDPDAPNTVALDTDVSADRAAACIQDALAQYRGWHPERFNAPEAGGDAGAEVDEVQGGLASPYALLSVDDAVDGVQDDEGVGGADVMSPGERRAAAEADLRGPIS